MNIPAESLDRITIRPADEPTVQLFPVIADPEAGVILCERYALEQLIGRGGTSLVFRATDLHRALAHDRATRCVAVKFLRTDRRTDPRAVGRLRREFHQMQRLSHPGIVQVFDLDSDGDICFISMELIVGQSARTWMQTGGSAADALRIIVGCGEALEHAHSMGIVHADLKPTNVMLANDGTIKLIDFGSAATHDSEGLNPTVAATPLYASPQILAGKAAEPRDDVFGLACLSYGILSGGRHPFGGRPSYEDGRAKSAPNRVHTIPAALFEVIERGLSAERERRQATARDYLRELTAAAYVPARANATSGKHVSVTASGPLRVASARRRVDGARILFRRAQPMMVPVASAIAIVGVAMLFQLGSRRDAIRTAELPAASSISSPQPTPATAPIEVIAPSASLASNDGVISFESSFIHASAGQSMVAITVKRGRAISRRAAFAYRVESGTARPGVDYERMQPQVVRFIEGQAARTLFIPLINVRSPSVPGHPRTFTVTLQQVAGGPAVGRFPSITVRIDPSSRPLEFSARNGVPVAEELRDVCSSMYITLEHHWL